MDLVLDPFSRGQEDREHPGIFLARVPGTNIGGNYVVDAANWIIYVSDFYAA